MFRKTPKSWGCGLCDSHSRKCHDKRVMKSQSYIFLSVIAIPVCTQAQQFLHFLLEIDSICPDGDSPGATTACLSKAPQPISQQIH